MENSTNFISLKVMMINNLFKKYIEITIGNKTDDIIKALFQLLLARYPIGLETSMKGRVLSLIVLMDYTFSFYKQFNFLIRPKIV